MSYFGIASKGADALERGLLMKRDGVIFLLENSTDYSIQNTLRQALFLPTSREAKYKAKAAIDTFFTRGGDVLSAGAVALGSVSGLPTSAFAGLNVVMNWQSTLAAQK